MNKHISHFMLKQTCASICCVDEQGMPYCFSCFYVFNAEKYLLYFKSHADTKHSGILLKNPAAAGTILPDKLSFLKIKGVQFEGIVLSGNDPLTRNASVHYHKKHPVALKVPGTIWTIQINNIKFTDNSPGFGKKIIWKRETPVAGSLQDL